MHSTFPKYNSELPVVFGTMPCRYPLATFFTKFVKDTISSRRSPSMALPSLYSTYCTYCTIQTYIRCPSVSLFQLDVNLIEEEPYNRLSLYKERTTESSAKFLKLEIRETFQKPAKTSGGTVTTMHNLLRSFSK